MKQEYFHRWFKHTKSSMRPLPSDKYHDMNLHNLQHLAVNNKQYLRLKDDHHLAGQASRHASRWIKPVMFTDTWTHTTTTYTKETSNMQHLQLYLLIQAPKSLKQDRDEDYPTYTSAVYLL